ncbi:retrotransposon protein, putative, ty1-copia subclass [Tanacetum coccineum]
MKNYVELKRLGYVLPQELSVGLILNGLTETSITWGRQLVNYMLCSLSKGKANGKGKDKQVYIPKPKNPKPSAKEHPAKDDTCHHCKEVGHCKRNCPAYLAELIKKKKQVGTASSSDAFVICLDNCHYAPSITRCVISVHRLVENGFVQRFTDFGISVSKNNVHYFNVIPSNGIYEIDMHNLVPNVNSIYNVSTKRAKHNLDSTYLWHCRLARISKKHIEKLQHEGLLKLTDAYGIVQQLTPPYTPQHNGVSERRNRTLLDMVRSMMNLTTLPLSFWDYALESATRNLNMVLTKKLDKTPYELWSDKLQQRSVKCIFIGYPKETMGYYFYFPPENKIVVASEIPMEVEGFEPPQEEEILIRRSERTRRATNRLCLNVEVEEHSLGDLGEPANYKAAMLDPESKKWVDAINAEMQSMIDNMVWVLVDLPPNCKTVGSKWIFKKKTDMDGNVHIYKARLVAKGYTQTYMVDYEETFSPVADIRAVRILISIATFYDYEIWQMDVKTAFLNGYLDEDIYMVQPEGEAAFILGIKIYRDRSKRLIVLSKNAYMDKILKRYKMDNSKRGTISMQERLDLNKSEGAQTPKEVNRMKNVPYASAVGSIMYAVRCTRPDVAFAQNLTSRFQQNPGELHWTAHTKSQTGYVFVLNGGAVDWKSSKQSTIAMSATESEYIAASEAAIEAV